MNVDKKVLQFSGVMIEKLTKNNHKPGWKYESLQALIGRMKDEVEELEKTVTDSPSRGYRNRIILEAADIANYAMMVADIARNM